MSMKATSMLILYWTTLLMFTVCRRHYNEQRPYSSLGYQTPSEIAAMERDKCQSLTFALAS